MILLGLKNCDKIRFELRVGVGRERESDKTRFEFLFFKNLVVAK